MTNLYISLYDEPNPERFAELMICLNINIKNKNIDRIIILSECDLVLDFKKITLIKINKRPTFNDIFDVVNSLTGEGDINIIANSDIYFTDLPKLPQRGECFALTRWNINYGEATFFNRKDSQDCWLFRNKIKPMDADFNLGHPGCDNALAEIISKAGYIISNPSLTLRTYHLHNDEKREWHNLQPIEKKYLLLPPCL